jgi:protein-disulfide isomerase
MSNKKSFFWIAGVVVVLAGVMFWAVKSESDITPPFEINAVHPLDHVEGNKDSRAVIVEYSDFECPACRAYYLVFKRLTVQFGGKMAFVYRSFPLSEIHKNAEPAAWAAEAAGRQGKFWEMHDLLFEKQNEWAQAGDPEPLFESYSKLLNISIDKFKADYNSKEVRNFVKAQRNSAIKAGLQGTPSFFLNGKQIQNPTTTEAFIAVIKTAIAE